VAKHPKPERADVKVAQKLSHARNSPVVRALGTFSELADQPQLNTIRVATIGVGLISGNRRMAKAGFRMLATQLLSTRLKGLIKHRVDRTRPKAIADGRKYERHAGENHASEMNSFPSGHTAGAVAVARSFAREYPEHQFAAYTGAAAIGLIQVPRSKHYPSDVAAEIVVGLVADQLVAGAERLSKRTLRRQRRAHSLSHFVQGVPSKEIPMSEHDISVLNGLTTTTLDSMKGYEDAAKDAESTRFASMFADFARDRGQAASALQAEVTRLGGTPATGTSFLAGAHRAFSDLKQAFTSNDDKAIIVEVERGEDHIKAKFEDALNDGDLSPEATAVIRDAFTSVRAGHDQMSALKHSMA
jgi:uncharacterized protein (TIGR02284 family)